MRVACCFLLVLSLALLAGCKSTSQTTKYVETDRGLIRYSLAYCELGMLLNNDCQNILDENKKPISCSGEVHLTEEQFKNYRVEVPR